VEEKRSFAYARPRLESGPAVHSRALHRVVDCWSRAASLHQPSGLLSQAVTRRGGCRCSPYRWANTPNPGHSAPDNAKPPVMAHPKMHNASIKNRFGASPFRYLLLVECILLSSWFLEIPEKSLLQICVAKLTRNRIISVKPCLTRMAFLKCLHF